MITAIISKIPFIDKSESLDYYLKLGFKLTSDFGNYIILHFDQTELHLFEFKDLQPSKSHFMLYLRVENIDNFYTELIKKKIAIHPNGKLEVKPWHQKEFSIVDPAGTLLTFGESIS